MRILLFGANGQLAQDLKVALTEDEVIGLTHGEVDIRDYSAVEAAAKKHQPNCLLNTAAFHRVDECEDQVEPSFAVNAAGVHNLVRVANQCGAVLVHFSTDYVFEGVQRKPRVETDAPNPQSIYALSKLAGELIVRRYAQKYFLIRTCGLYGRAGSGGKGGNFVETMLRLARAGKPIRVVSDQVLTPTSTKDLAEKFAPLLHTNKYGLYHMTNTGECSWCDFAAEIFRLAGLTPDLQPTTSAAFGAKARRPAYSVLDNLAYRNAGFADFRPWQEALADYLEGLIRS
ncbi:MAG: dTDP-4-dehydrorhamnose reductase [Candidatus Acidiferrales bacterium]